MIEEKAAWEFNSKYGLNKYYGNVDTYVGRVIGTWFCLDADSGELIWEKRMDRPNSIRGCSRGIIAVTESVIGMGLSNHGAYGVSLETGEVKWSFPERGSVGRFFRAIGLLKESDSAKYVTETLVHCASGKRLNIEDGSPAKVKAPKEVELKSVHEIEAHKLYDGKTVWVNDALGQKMSTEAQRAFREKAKSDRETYSDMMWGQAVFGFSADDPDGWMFDSRALGYSHSGNFFAYRYHAPYVYFVGKEGDYYIDKGDNRVDHRTAPCHVLTLDARNGGVVQDFLLPEEAHEYRIESIGENGILLSHSNSYLALHRFLAS